MALLEHIVSKHRIVMDLEKVKTILQASAPTNAKALNWFLGKIQWHSQICQYLVDFATFPVNLDYKANLNLCYKSVYM